MSASFRSACLSLGWIAGAFVPPAAEAGPQLPAALESRLTQIYNHHEFDTVPVSPGRWLKTGGYVLFEATGTDEVYDLIRYEPTSGKRELLFAASKLRKPGSAEPLAFDPFALAPSPAFAFSPDATSVLLVTNGRSDEQGVVLADLWLLNLKSDALEQVATNAEDPSIDELFSPDGTRIAYVQARNLFVRTLGTGAVTQLTTDGVLDRIGNGVSEWGDAFVRWSPDSRSIAYAQSDVSGVGRFPIVNYTKATYPDVHFQRFPKVGTPITAVRVGVVSANGGATRWMKVPADANGHYIEQIRWTPDSSRLVIQKLSRGRDVVDVLAADPRTGEVTSLHREQDKAWLRDSFANDFSLEWLEKGRAFTWLSERDGWRRAYAISSDGGKWTALTPESVDVISIAKVDANGGALYYIASPTNATQRYLYRTSLKTGGHAERITPAQQSGTHSYNISPDGRFAVHAYTSADTPPVTELIELEGHRVVRVLQDNAALRDKLKAWSPRPTEFLKIAIEGGIEMDAWMLKPRDFDPSKKYPVFIYVYGEPASQTVLDRWSVPHQLFHRAIADAGYLVVSIDNRGTPAPKGAAWRRASFLCLGPLSTDEQAAALEVLGRTRPYVDLDRVGIWGWSAGGTNTLNALFRKPDQYHVGIAVVPKPRPELYNAWFQEIFMRTPQENPEGYRLAAPINYAEGLKGNLLIVTGSGETNTHVQIIDHLVNRLVELGKPFDYMSYPNRNHSMREGAETYPHLHRLIARYLTDHLPAGARNAK